MSSATAVVLAAATLRPQMVRTFETAIVPELVRVSHVRRITAAFMRLWNVPAPLADDVRLVVSELAANAIEHGHGTVGLRMWRTDDELRIEVSDDNPAPAQLRAADDEDTGGRGLFLVAHLASGWGVSDDGRITWATFRICAGRP